MPGDFFGGHPLTVQDKHLNIVARADDEGPNWTVTLAQMIFVEVLGMNESLQDREWSAHHEKWPLA